MTPRMVTEEIRKLLARRGLFLSAVLVPLAGVVAITVILLIIRSQNPEDYSGGADLAEGLAGVTAFLVIIMAAIVGATSGAWDVANGTFRYLLMTGRSRISLYLARVPALMAVVVLMVLPSAIVAIVVSAVLPLGGAEAASASDHALVVWTPVLQGWVYGIVAFGVGALLRSVGGAIAIALVLNLAGLQLLLLLGFLSERLGDLMLPAAVSRLVGGDVEISIAAAAVSVLVWMAAFIGAGAVRTVKAEY